MLIADAGEEFRRTLQEYLKDDYTIRLCREGNETLQAIESYEPDVLVLDMLLPGVDGVTLLQRAVKNGLQATVLATTRFQSAYILDAVERLGVGYVIVKPCEVSAVAARLEDLMQGQREEVREVTQPDLQTVVDNVLRELSVQTHPRGYACLRAALLEAVREPGQQVTKTLYPTVGKICGGNGKQVERAIRRLIKQAWLYRDADVWNRWFASGTECLTQCPSNKVFICTIASRILAEKSKKDTYLWRIG